ncbi:MAG: hypothetical protein AAB783_01070 [Patescibacteria group bacterium]
MSELRVGPVTFANKHHFYWFITSVLFLVTILSIRALSVWKGDADLIFLGQLFCIMAATLLGQVSARAFYVVCIKKLKSDIFSGHCVWWNALLALIYILNLDSIREPIVRLLSS